MSANLGRPTILDTAEASGIDTRSRAPGRGGVADGTRTRNDQNHNLGIYH